MGFGLIVVSYCVVILMVVVLLLFVFVLDLLLFHLIVDCFWVGGFYLWF